MNDVYKIIKIKIESKIQGKILTVFDYMIADILNNKKVNLIVTELFIRVRKLNISLAFFTQTYFFAPKNIRLNFIHDFIIKIPNKVEIQQMKIIHQILTLKT